MADFLGSTFGLAGRVAVVTGGTGVLGGALAGGLARAGARVAVLGRRRELGEARAAEIAAAGGEAMAVAADVLRRDQLEAALDRLRRRWGRLDILVNAAGGNLPGATTPPGGSFFDIPVDALRAVVELNLFGTVLACQVLGQALEDGGCVVNVSSMAAQRPLTRVAGYAAAKAAVENLTRWLAVELGRQPGRRVRVNALAPGFFIGEQNRSLLLDEAGGLTERGQTIIDHTPLGRFGEPDELAGALVWLCGPSAAFVNGVVLPVDGGFGAFGGV